MKIILLTFLIGCAAFAFAQERSTHHAIDLANLDQTVKPSSNFYDYAVGNWVKKNPVPASKSAWFSFNELYNFNRTILHKLLVEISASRPASGTNAQKIADYFNSGMDSTTRNELGYKPLIPYLKQIDQIADASGVLKHMTAMYRLNLATAYSFYIRPDRKNSNKYLAGFAQGGLGLPDRDYYLKTDAKTISIRAAYLGHVASMLSLIGIDSGAARRDAADILKLETALATSSMDRVSLRDPYKTYHKFTLAEIAREVPGIDWNNQLTALGVPSPDTIIVSQPEFYKTFSALLSSTPVSTWKNYLRWKLISSSANDLSDKIEKESFNFYGRVLNGSKVQEQRWERLTSRIDRTMGEALGQEYVKRAFPPEAKSRMLKLIANLKASFAERIAVLDWMSAETKAKALVKINAITVKVGYPDKWIDYSSLQIVPGNFFKNALNTSKFLYDYDLERYGKPVDKAVWGMSPPTVNAYYSPSFNEIVFPAGILQPPFFDFKADDAVNYGAIGSVIGHEMTHGFDDQGRQYDAAGNLKDWWTKADGEKFKAKAERVARQFDTYTVLDTVHVNGHLTLGENLADLGGTMIAYQAFKKTDQGKSNVKVDDFTPDQRFFLGFAQLWRGNINPEAAAVRIKTDPHSPGKWRVIGPLSNNTDFYAAFGVKPGDPMYRTDAERIRVW